MSPLQRAALRFLGLWAVLAGVELLERVAYRAGVYDVERPDVDEDLADDLAAADVSDVVAAHTDCCGPLWCPAEEPAA